MRSIIDEKGGQMTMMVNLIILIMTIAILIAMIPMMKTFMNIGSQSDYLNCPGYEHDADPTNVLSYNSSLDSETVSCLAFDLYLPYIILVIVVGGVSKLIMGRGAIQS